MPHDTMTGGRPPTAAWEGWRQAGDGGGAPTHTTYPHCASFCSRAHRNCLTRHTSRFAYLLVRGESLLSRDICVPKWIICAPQSGNVDFPVYFFFVVQSVIKAHICAWHCDWGMCVWPLDIGCVMCISTLGRGNRDMDLFLVAHTD